ncbi:MAG: hypothetical protein AB7F99_09015 [Vicinamibacterales bacterium]
MHHPATARTLNLPIGTTSVPTLLPELPTLGLTGPGLLTPPGDTW